MAKLALILSPLTLRFIATIDGWFTSLIVWDTHSDNWENT